MDTAIIKTKYATLDKPEAFGMIGSLTNDLPLTLAIVFKKVNFPILVHARTEATRTHETREL